MRSVIIPDLSWERAAIRAGSMVVAGCDEVGRGALGGPVSVGVVVLSAAVLDSVDPPSGLRDSKLLRAAARESLVPAIREWAAAFAVGNASAAEIDEFGILRALRLAGERAIAALPIPPDLVLLDGNYDWFARPVRVPHSPMTTPVTPVELRVKADLTCASVAAASVLAKVERDRHMVDLAAAYPAYGWDQNKGYASPGHLAALREQGPCIEHRRSWRIGPDQDELPLIPVPPAR
jgi:ribonuclease HII